MRGPHIKAGVEGHSLPARDMTNDNVCEIAMKTGVKGHSPTGWGTITRVNQVRNGEVDDDSLARWDTINAIQFMRQL